MFGLLALKQVRVKVIGQLEQRKVKLHKGRIQRVLPLHTPPPPPPATKTKPGESRKPNFALDDL